MSKFARGCCDDAYCLHVQRTDGDTVIVDIRSTDSSPYHSEIALRDAVTIG